MKKEINTRKAPLPVGPYSQAVLVGNALFISGQIGIDPETGKLVEGFESQVVRIFKNLEEILKSAGFELYHVVKVSVYMVEDADFKLFNSLYSEFFKGVEIKPARSTIIVRSLPLGALLEIDAIAIK